MTKLEHFQDYLFHYNPYQDLWFAFKREDSVGYFNGEDVATTSAHEIKHLIRYINGLIER
jgi:hypothetical protein